MFISKSLHTSTSTLKDIIKHRSLVHFSRNQFWMPVDLFHLTFLAYPDLIQLRLACILPLFSWSLVLCSNATLYVTDRTFFLSSQHIGFLIQKNFPQLPLIKFLKSNIFGHPPSKFPNWRNRLFSKADTIRTSISAIFPGDRSINRDGKQALVGLVINRAVVLGTVLESVHAGEDVFIGGSECSEGTRHDYSIEIISI